MRKGYLAAAMGLCVLVGCHGGHSSSDAPYTTGFADVARTYAYMALGLGDAVKSYS